MNRHRKLLKEEQIPLGYGLSETHLSSVEKYELEWIGLCTELSQNNMEGLRRLAVLGDLKVSKFRSICWALMLGVLQHDPTNWIRKRRQDRENYQKLKATFFHNPNQQDDPTDDPLSQSTQSVWHQHFCDQELCSVIKQDVVRTFPGVDFFRKSYIQDIMINILFCYARQYPKMCYRQGMHEILAPLLFVLHSDHQALSHIRDLNSSVNHTLYEVLDPKFLEEDSYVLFNKIMEQMECYYIINDLVPSASGHFPVATNIPSPLDSPEYQKNSELEIIHQLNLIRENILIKEDIHLHNHLLKLDISLAIFGIRWLRLLFGREFSQQDLLILWDAIFAEGDNLKLAHYIVVAMLIRIRDKLLTGDYTTCLQYLMRYPNNVDVSTIIKFSLHLKSPQIYERPDGVFVHVSPRRINQINPKSIILQRSATLPRNIKVPSSTIRKVDENRIRNSSPIGLKDANIEDVRIRASSLTKVQGIQNSAALAAMKAVSQSQVNPNDPGIVDGFLEDDPDFLKLELQHAHSIMSISRMKLIKYLAVLRRHARGHAHDEVHQALDGMEELCSLLRSRYTSPYNLPVPVDPAFEANEGQTRSVTPPNSLSLRSRKSIKITEHESKNQFVRNLQQEPHRDEDQYVVVVRNENTAYQESENEDVAEMKWKVIAQYEIPDTKVTRKAAKILGSRKEVELREIRHKEEKKEECGILPCTDPQRERKDSN